jgi:dTMP kinase
LDRRSSIERTLNDEVIVICDRYAFSGIAFSAAKGLPYEWCRAPDVSLPAPDLTLFLDISAEKAKERGGYGEERYEKEEMQKKVSQQFERIGEDMRDEQGKWIKVDAGQEKEIVADVIWKEVSFFVGGLENHVGRLWM